MANRKYPNAVQERKARTKQVDKYHKKAMKTFTFRFHRENDANVIAKIKSQKNKCDYIRQLILNDINKGEE